MSSNATLAPSGTGAIHARLGRAAGWICLVLILFGTGCRLRLLLANQSFWYDEAYLLTNVQDKNFEELLGPTKCQQAAPPFYLWMLRAIYLMSGTTEWALRLPSIVAGALAIVVAIPLGRRLAGRAGAVWFVLFVAMSLHGLTLSNDVKPYTIDLLFTELVLLAGAACLIDEGRSRWRAMGGLIALGALGPWLSYPIVFSLGGVGVAWVIHALVRRERAIAIGVILYGLIGLASCLLLWHFVARHQRTAELATFWKLGFIDLADPQSILMTTGRIVRKLGDYASTGLGIPFLFLTPAGWFIIARRSGTTTIMLVTTLLLALTASAMKYYPLDDRLTMFAAPLIWLPAAVAIDKIVQHLRGRFGWAILFGLFMLPVSDLGRVCVQIKRGAYGTEFRESYRHYHEHYQPGDALWQPYAEVYEVYHGRTIDGFDAHAPVEAILASNRHGRLWLISPPNEAARELLVRLQTCLTGGGMTLIDERHYRGVVVFLYSGQPAGK